MNAEKSKIVETVFELADDMGKELCKQQFRREEIIKSNYRRVTYVRMSRNYLHALSYHVNLIKGFTRSIYRNKDSRSFFVRIKAEQIAKETGAPICEVEEFLKSRLNGRL